MKKLMNAPENYVEDMLRGIYAAYPDQLKPAGSDLRCLVTAKKKHGKVAIVTGGGSGHLPLFLGYVGDGMLDGCAVGEVFQSPSAEQILTVTREADAGAGVLHLFGNYNGDKFNFRLASEMAEFEHGIRVHSVIAGDDIAAEAEPDGSMPGKRRGVAGIFFVYKCAGAAAKSGLDLESVKNVALESCRNVRTLGVALSACILPRVGKPGFQVAEDEIEIGMGIHGEPGIRIEKMKSSDEIVKDMMGALLADLSCVENDEVAVLVNGLGSTPLDELYIMMGRVAAILAGKGIRLYRSYVGEYATSMEMSGASVSLFKLNADLKPYLDAEADTPFFKQFRTGK